MNNSISLHILLNPIAGHGQSIRMFSRLENLLEDHKIPYDTEVSPYPSAFISIARKYGNELHSSNEYLTVIGGDGSLNDVLNGIKTSSHPETPIVYIPAGSGNDFARGAKISTNLQSLIQKLLNKTQPEQIDCGSYEGYKRNSELLQRSYFVNNFGIGFDAYVVHQSNRQRLKNALNKINFGSLIYKFNVINVLKKQDTFSVTIKAKDEIWQYDNVYMATTTNHPYFGGGVAIMPQATVTDHQLWLAVVQKPSWSKFIKLFSKILRDGSQINDPQFHVIKADEIEISTSKPEFCQIDGEDSADKLPFHVRFKVDHFNLIK